MSELVFFLEEPSAQAVLDGVLPRLLPDIAYRCIVFEGKQDLEKQLVRRMRHYRVPDARFVVLRDQDAGDCTTVKAGLAWLCCEAGHPKAVVRVACRELESWYLADLSAVESGLEVSGLAKLQNKQKYRAPDLLFSPSQELAKIAPRYQKVGGSRAIGPYLDLGNTRSRSFATFISGVRRAVETTARVG